MKISSLAKPTAAALALTFCGMPYVAAQENDSPQATAPEQVDNAEKSSEGDAKKDQKSKTCPISGLRVDDKQEDAKGLAVADVKPDSAADKAGIKKGDRLVAINDTEVDSADQMHKLLAEQQQKSDEAEVNVKLLRDEQDQQVTLTIQSQDAQNAASDQAKKDAQAKKDQAKKDDQRQKDDQANREGAEREAQATTNPSEVMDDHEDLNNRDDRDKKKEDAKKKASLGVTLDPSPSQRGEGVRISSVYTNGPAQRAGLKTGDRILKVDGREILTVTDLQDSIDKMDPNHKAELTVVVDGEEESLDVVVASKAETIKRAMVGIESAAVPSAQSANADESLRQTLTEIRDELRDLRRRVDAMEKGGDDGDRGDQNDSNSNDAGQDQ